MAKLQIGFILAAVIAFAIYNRARLPLPQVVPGDADNLPLGQITIIDGHPVENVFQSNNVQIVDGDSLRLVDYEGNQREIRLASIDAPELSQSFGRQAKAHLETLVAGKLAAFYQIDTDQYGRSVAFVFVAANSPNDQPLEVNAQMIADGYAWHAIKHSQNERLTELESAARRLRTGLWSEPTSTPPWEFRSPK